MSKQAENNLEATIRSVIKRSGYEGTVSSGEQMLEIKPVRNGVVAIVHNGMWGFPTSMAKNFASSLRDAGLAAAFVGDGVNNCVFAAEDEQAVNIDRFGLVLLSTVGRGAK